MKLFVDTANLEELEQCLKRGFPSGVTTNPAILSKEQHRDFKAQYFGDLRARDAAYHQGTVWAWLIGPFIDAWLRAYPARHAEARSFLTAFNGHLSDACIGTISEVFDATEPYAARGCVAQAWSVAEVLRSFVNLRASQEDSSARAS